MSRPSKRPRIRPKQLPAKRTRGLAWRWMVAIGAGVLFSDHLWCRRLPTRHYGTSRMIYPWKNCAHLLFTYLPKAHQQRQCEKIVFIPREKLFSITTERRNFPQAGQASLFRHFGHFLFTKKNRQTDRTVRHPESQVKIDFLRPRRRFWPREAHSFNGLVWIRPRTFVVAKARDGHMWHPRFRASQNPCATSEEAWKAHNIPVI